MQETTKIAKTDFQNLTIILIKTVITFFSQIIKNPSLKPPKNDLQNGPFLVQKRVVFGPLKPPFSGQKKRPKKAFSPLKLFKKWGTKK